MQVIRPRCYPLAAACAALLLAGCGGGQKDVDAHRSGAKPIAAIGVETDKISAETGDLVDYKLLSLPDKGILSLQVHWDNPKVKAWIKLMDKFGVLLDSKERNPSTNTDTIDRPVLPGTYFLELSIEEGASVYSVDVKFHPTGGPSEGEDDPVPYCIELMEGKGGDKGSQASDDDEGGGGNEGGSGGSGGGGAAAAAAPPPAMAPMAPGMAPMAPGMAPMAPGMAPGMAPMAPAPVAPPPAMAPMASGGGGIFDDIPEPPGPKRSLIGGILRVADVGGKAEVTIDKGKMDGVKLGVRGDLLNASNRPISGGRLVVTKVYDRSCKAGLEISADSVPDTANVNLEVPQ